jgi:hypothetical protein
MLKEQSTTPKNFFVLKNPVVEDQSGEVITNLPGPPDGQEHRRKIADQHL